MALIQSWRFRNAFDPFWPARSLERAVFYFTNTNTIVNPKTKKQRKYRNNSRKWKKRSACSACSASLTNVDNQLIRFFKSSFFMRNMRNITESAEPRNRGTQKTVSENGFSLSFLSVLWYHSTNQIYLRGNLSYHAYRFYPTQTFSGILYYRKIRPVARKLRRERKRSRTNYGQAVQTASNNPG